MTVFLLDLWRDLREKRLLPVAVALAVALVAVPALLLKHASAEPATSASPATAKAPENPLTEAIGVQSGDSSDLGVFDPKNPFKPPHGAFKDAAASATAGGLPVTPTPSPAPSSGASASSAGSAPASSGGGSATAAPAPAPAPAPKVIRKVTRYTYVVDVHFGHTAHLHRYHGVRRLEMLPNEDAPLLISLGVDANADHAVFLVDSTLKPAGEGRCKPRPSQCALLFMRAGMEETFAAADGSSYRLVVDRIRRVKLGRTQVKTSARRAHATAAGTPTHAFLPPLLTDVVAVTAAASR